MKIYNLHEMDPAYADGSRFVVISDEDNSTLMRCEKLDMAITVISGLKKMGKSKYGATRLLPIAEGRAFRDTIVKDQHGGPYVIKYKATTVPCITWEDI